MQQEVNNQQSKKWRPSPVIVIAIILLIVSLTGTAWAALGKNSVGSRQLKATSVTTGKLANNAVNGAKVASHSLTGADINLGALGTVPAATDAAHASDADTVGGHGASCPPATTLIRGICFDPTSNPVAPSVKAAADACAAKDGYLPTPLDLFATRGILNLGTGVGTDHQYTNTYYANTSGANYRTIVVDGTGAMLEQGTETPSEYICAYPLVR